MIKVSVIVPVYNVAPYLARCLDLLVGQTLQEIEIICIDDKSTDNSLALLRAYEKKDARIKVIALKQNGGAAIARNAGLDCAQGEYLGFVDPDDYVDRDFFEKLYDAAKRENADLAKGEVLQISEDGTTKKMGPSFKSIQRNKINFSGSWWTAVYRRALIVRHGIRFVPELITGQDSVFLMNSVLLANKIALVPDVYYHYIKREGSLDSARLSDIKILSDIKVVDIITDLFNTYVDGREDYISTVGGWIKYLIFGISYRAGTDEGRAAVARGSIDIWKKIKYKDLIAKRYLTPFTAKCLESDDDFSLARYFTENGVADSDKTLRLFGLPLIRRVVTPKRTHYKLFSKITLLRIQRGRNLYYKLFGVIPVFVRT